MKFKVGDIVKCYSPTCTNHDINDTFVIKELDIEHNVALCQIMSGTKWAAWHNLSTEIELVSKNQVTLSKECLVNKSQYIKVKECRDLWWQQLNILNNLQQQEDNDFLNLCKK